MRRSLCRTFFRPERPTLTSRSLQSITRPFQKRFREVFGNARILNFNLSIKAWDEKSSPKSHLGSFFLVFGEGKATKENVSIFWFIWPLSSLISARPDDIVYIFIYSLIYSLLLLCRCDQCKLCYHFQCLDPPIKVSSVLKGPCHEDIAFLGQFCAEVITSCL